MLKLASVSLPFGKKSQTRQNQSSHTPACQPAPPDAGSAETSLGLPTSHHTNSGSVSLKRRYQLIHFKLVQSQTAPSTSASSKPSKPTSNNNNNCAEPAPNNNSSPSASASASASASPAPASKRRNQLAPPPPHPILPSADTEPSETLHPNDLLNPQGSKPSRLRSSSSSSLHSRHNPPPPPADPNAMAASGNMYEHDPSQLFSSAFNPPSAQPSNIINYNNHQLSLLRRHHTLSTAGTHLARLEKEHALANMVEKDRRFYGGSDCETGSLSGSESLESRSLESRSNFCLTPLESDHHHYPHREQPRVLSELSDLIAQPQPPPSRGTPLPQPGFQLIRAYKGTGCLRSQHLGPPSHLAAGAQSQLNGTAASAITTASHSTTTPTAVPSHPNGANQLNTGTNNCQSHTSTIEHHPGPQSPQVSVTLPFNSPVALHRNFSSPSKLQHCSTTSPTATIRPSHPSNSYLLPPSWKRVSLLNPTLMKPTDSAIHLLQTLQPTRSLSDGSRTFSQATEEESDEQTVGSCCVTSNLHRATSDRVSSTVNDLNASQPPSSNALSQWSEQSNLRRHQSLKSDGKWGTCLITSPTTEASSEQESLSLNDSNRNKLDTFYEFGSSIGNQSTDLLRSSSHRSNSSAAFNNSSTNASIGSFSQSGGIVTTMSSPVSVPGLSINPWSPSVEEAKKLREPMLRQASLDTLASHSSNGSHPMQKSNTTDLSRFRSCSNDETQGREVNLLHTNFARINLGQSKNGEDLASRSTKGLTHRVSGVKSPLSTSTSLAELSEPATSDAEPPKPITTTKKVALPPLVTDFSRVTSLVGGAQAQKPVDSIKRHPNGVSLLFQGPASAAAFVPPIGHSLSRNISDPFNFHEKMALMAGRNTAAPGIGASNWLTQKERLVGDSQSRQQSGEWGSTPHSRSPSSQTPSASLQNLPQQIHQQMILNQQLQQIQQLQAQQHQLQQQQVQLLNSTMGLSATSSANGSNPPLMNNLLQNNSFNYMSPATSGALFANMNASNSVSAPAPNPSRLQTTITGLPGLPSLSGASPNSLPSSTGAIGAMGGTNVMNIGQPMPLMPNLGLAGSHPFSVQELARQKGYNPINFDVSPKSCRFFVIKSYTEEDVHKSLKYEIWASTDLGNKRLDRAFHESHESGPIYLLFSVNASGHFCGMAEMLTAVDYNTTSKVWAQDKWKGIFKVRWVFVKDIPNNALRHIKLTNTPENKPITSSRDTQEVPHDKGVQVLQIMSSYQSRTTLLQDYAWYEHNETLKSQQQQTIESSNQVPVTVQSKSKTQNHNESSNGSNQNRHSGNLVQNANQNIRRFTHAQHHPGHLAPVTVQVASGI